MSVLRVGCFFASNFLKSASLTALVVSLNLVAGTSLRAADPAYLWRHVAGSRGGVGSNDGLSTVARFNHPTGLTIDASGNVYVADTNNNTIRKITPAGSVSTVAGSVSNFSYASDYYYPTNLQPDIGPYDLAENAGSNDGSISAARFNYPSSVAVANSGNIYVTDQANQSIRKITPAGDVSTLVGSERFSGAAGGIGVTSSFGEPAAIVVDDLENLYVADATYHTIRKVTPAGVVSTLAGETGYSGDLDGKGPAARFYHPSGLALGPSGNLYVSDTDNAEIRKITPDGVVTTLAGGKAHGWLDAFGQPDHFNGPTGIAVDRAENVYVADRWNSLVRKITPAGVVSTLLNTDHLGEPIGLTVDRAGVIYVTGLGEGSICKVTAAGALSTFAGSNVAAGSNDGPGDDARFDSPVFLTLDRSENVYLTDSRNYTIRRISPAGAVTTAVSLAGWIPLGKDEVESVAPLGIDFDPAGNMFVADAGTNTIRKIDTAGVVSVFAGSPEIFNPHVVYVGGGWRYFGPFYHPFGLGVDSSANVYFSLHERMTIYKLTPQGELTLIAGNEGTPGFADGPGDTALFSSPSGVAVDAAGNVYVADSANHVIRKIDPAHTVSTIAGSPSQWGSADGIGDQARFYYPVGIAVDRSGTLYVTDRGNRSIRKITPTGAVSTIGGDSRIIGNNDGLGSAARFNALSGIAVTKSGKIYVVDSGNNAVSVGLDSAQLVPQLTTQPLSLSAPAGSTVQFSVTATDASTFLWFKDGVALAGATSSTLTITNLQSGDAGNYAVTVSNVYGSVTSSSAVLTLLPASDLKLVNLSTRSYVGTGDSVQIAGFIVGGTQPKKVLVRASGPALSQYNISGVLPDPTLTLYSGSTIIAQNDDWGSDLNVPVFTSASGATAFVQGSKDSALAMTLQPGAYTAIVSGKNGTTGVSLVEVFEADGMASPSKLVNLSTRSQVLTSDQVQIAGFITTGTKKLLIRASGPALTQYNVSGVLADPVITLFSGSTVIGQNDDWGSDAAVPTFTAAAGVPSFSAGSKDAALAVTVPAGAYTAVVSGKNNTTGVALIEVFEVP